MKFNQPKKVCPRCDRRGIVLAGSIMCVACNAELDAIRKGKRRRSLGVGVESHGNPGLRMPTLGLRDLHTAQSRSQNWTV